MKEEHQLLTECNESETPTLTAAGRYRHTSEMWLGDVAGSVSDHCKRANTATK